jgi:hypothetical protein
MSEANEENQSATPAGRNPAYMGPSVNPLGTIVDILRAGASTPESEALKHLINTAILERRQEREREALDIVQEGERLRLEGARRQRWMIDALLWRVYADTDRLIPANELAERFNIYMSAPDILAQQDPDAWIQVDLIRNGWAPIRADVRLDLDGKETTPRVEGFKVLRFEHGTLRESSSEPRGATVYVEWQEDKTPKPIKFGRACLEAMERGQELAGLWATWESEGKKVIVR